MTKSYGLKRYGIGRPSTAGDHFAGVLTLTGIQFVRKVAVNISFLLLYLL